MNIEQAAAQARKYERGSTLEQAAMACLLREYGRSRLQDPEPSPEVLWAWVDGFLWAAGLSTGIMNIEQAAAHLRKGGGGCVREQEAYGVLYRAYRRHHAGRPDPSAETLWAWVENHLGEKI